MMFVLIQATSISAISRKVEVLDPDQGVMA